MKRTSKRILTGIGVLTLAGAAGLSLNSTAAQQVGIAMADDNDAARESIRVGTFQPQAAFERYHRSEELSRDMQRFQQEMHQAQQEGDEPRMMQIQQLMQQRQNEVIEAFYDDLDRAMPEVAKDAKVQLVAVDVIYADPEIGEAEDLTATIVNHLNNDEEAEQRPERPGDPTSPW